MFVRMRTFTTLDEVTAASGSEIGTSEWLDVDQARIDAFADATLDHQWIHVDVDAAGKGPFGTTIAHGFLTLSLLPHFASQVFRLETPGARLNYGLEKVRFPHPVRVGSKVRLAASVVSVEDVAGGVQSTFDFIVQIDGVDKPACVARPVYRHYV